MKSKPRSIGVLVSAALLACCVLSVVLRANHANDRRLLASHVKYKSPTVSRKGGYVSSDACRSCHPGEYASWHRTYHRTMTQVATPESVKGDFDDVTLRYFGREFHLSESDGSYWISQTGGGSERVLQTTGSHHYQVYWVSGSKGNMLHNFPFVYLLEDQRWARRNDVFMMPPSVANQPETIQPWNNGCIACHSTFGQPQINVEAKFAKTEVAELGISCEACHGPAADHIRHYSDPLNRYRQHFSKDETAFIVNPATCASKQSTQICGQCHGVSRSHDRKAWQQRGFLYRPGDELTDSRIVARHPAKADQPWHAQADPNFFDQYFWNDGMIRVSGREYNGLLESPCYQRGELSCLSCHSMHHSDPDDQLKEQMAGNAACTQCHAEIGADVSRHTHHDVSSTGSLCYNCHMPHTTYGLLKAIRSHQIDSPAVSDTLRSGRPQACNLCHLDKSLGWTAQHLHEWYDQPEPTLTAQQQDVSAAVLGVLAGDAGQRAIFGWHMGWQPALEVSGRDWLAPFLAELLHDSYAVVRYIGVRSLRQLPGFRDFPYDFAALSDATETKVTEAKNVWRNAPQPSGGNEMILLKPTGELMLEELNSIRAQRSDRDVDLLE